MKIDYMRGLACTAKAFCLMWIATAGISSPVLAQTVTYNYADRVNFGEFKTCRWVHTEGATVNGMDIEFGHLVLDAYDSSYRDLVWRGRVTKAINFGQDSQKRRRQLNKAVAKLIEAFPYGPKE